MFQAVPDFFGVQICYIKKDLLNIDEIFHEINSNIELLDIKVRNPIVIGASFPNQSIPRWIGDKETMEKYANSKGIILKVEDADYDADLQGKQIEKLISAGVDVLIIAPLDSFNAGPIAEKAKNAGIKVISYDGLMHDSYLNLYMSFNGIQIGELQGKYLTQNVPKGNYIILSGDPSDDNSALYKEGAMEFISPLVNIGSIKIIEDKPVINWKAQNAYTIVKNALVANNNQVDAILAPSDEIAEGSIKALEEQGLAGRVAVTGQDADIAAIKRIIDGTQSMTVFNDSRELAKSAIDSAIKLVNGEYITTNALTYNGKMDVPTIFFKPVIVDRYNITDTIIKTGFLKSEDIYI